MRTIAYVSVIMCFLMCVSSIQLFGSNTIVVDTSRITAFSVSMTDATLTPGLMIACLDGSLTCKSMITKRNMVSTRVSYRVDGTLHNCNSATSTDGVIVDYSVMYFAMCDTTTTSNLCLTYTSTSGVPTVKTYSC
jgi:hypothetical protein